MLDAEPLFSLLFHQSRCNVLLGNIRSMEDLDLLLDGDDAVP